MKKSSTKVAVLLAGLIATAALGAAVSSADPMASDAVSQPATMGAATSQRSVDAIIEDIKPIDDPLRQIFENNTLTDPDSRAKVAKLALPLLDKLEPLYVELAAANPKMSDQLQQQLLRFQKLRVVLGDEKAIAKMTAAANGVDPKAAIEAKLDLATAEYVKSGDDAGLKSKILDKFSELAAGSGDNAALLVALSNAFGMTVEGAGDAPLSQGKIDAVNKILKIAGTLNNPNAKNFIDGATKIANVFESVGKPAAFEGTTVDGKKFSTADWKGKVVLVDFWATWCGPCLNELPHVQQLYKENHDKGLEIVGVSCDKTADDLKGFLAQNKDVMPWPELYDPASPDWNPIAKQWGVEGIPTSFLIDRSGVLRTLNARQKADDLIPKLLAEGAATKPAN